MNKVVIGLIGVLLILGSVIGYFYLNGEWQVELPVTISGTLQRMSPFLFPAYIIVVPAGAFCVVYTNISTSYPVWLIYPANLTYIVEDRFLSDHGWQIGSSVSIRGFWDGKTGIIGQQYTDKFRFVGT